MAFERLLEIIDESNCWSHHPRPDEHLLDQPVEEEKLEKTIDNVLTKIKN